MIFEGNIRIFAGSSMMDVGTSIIVAESSRIMTGSLRIVAAGSLRFFEDYRWGSSRFPLKILVQIFKDL